MTPWTCFVVRPGSQHFSPTEKVRKSLGFHRLLSLKTNVKMASVPQPPAHTKEFEDAIQCRPLSSHQYTVNLTWAFSVGDGTYPSGHAVETESDQPTSCSTQRRLPRRNNPSRRDVSYATRSDLASFWTCHCHQHAADLCPSMQYRASKGGYPGSQSGIQGVCDSCHPFSIFSPSCRSCHRVRSSFRNGRFHTNQTRGFPWAFSRNQQPLGKVHYHPP